MTTNGHKHLKDVIDAHDVYYTMANNYLMQFVLLSSSKMTLFVTFKHVDTCTRTEWQRRIDSKIPAKSEADSPVTITVRLLLSIFSVVGFDCLCLWGTLSFPVSAVFRLTNDSSLWREMGSFLRSVHVTPWRHLTRRFPATALNIWLLNTLSKMCHKPKLLLV